MTHSSPEKNFWGFLLIQCLLDGTLPVVTLNYPLQIMSVYAKPAETDARTAMTHTNTRLCMERGNAPRCSSAGCPAGFACSLASRGSGSRRATAKTPSEPTGWILLPACKNGDKKGVAEFYGGGRGGYHTTMWHTYWFNWLVLVLEFWV